MPFTFTLVSPPWSNCSEVVCVCAGAGVYVFIAQLHFNSDFLCLGLNSSNTTKLVNPSKSFCTERDVIIRPAVRKIDNLPINYRVAQKK